MFLSKERIEHELKDEQEYKDLTPKEKRFFLEYCTNGFLALEAYYDVYEPETKTRLVKFPGSKAEGIVASPNFEYCFDLFSDLLQSMVAKKTNAEIFNHYYTLATYNPLDFMNEEGEFAFDSIQTAKEILGQKAICIVGLSRESHPKDPSITIVKVQLYNRSVALKELAKFSRFFGSDEVGGHGFADINISLGSNMNDKPTLEDDQKARDKYGL